jgi:hypothetical protein
MALEKQKTQKEEKEDDPTTSNNDDKALESSFDWITDVLLPWSVESWPTASTFVPLQSIITLSTHVWIQSFTPVLLPKVKSHPDRAWSVVEGWMSLVQSDNDDDDNNNGSTTHNTGWMTDEWWEVVAKALVHPNKESYRAVAQRILVTWVHKSSSSSTSSSITQDTASWVHRIVTDPPPTLAPLRIHVYETLRYMAATANHELNDTKSTSLTCTKVASSLLPALISWWNKETKPEGKRACLQAAMAWIPDNITTNDTAWTSFWVAITSKSTDAGLVLLETPTHVWPWLAKAQSNVLKTWQTLVETAQTKRTVQPEGILALHASIVCTENVSSWVSKLMCTGSTKAVVTNSTTITTTTASTIDSSKKSPMTTAVPFFYQKSTWESVLADNPRMAASLAQCLVLYTEKSGDTALWKPNGSTCATHAMVYALLFPGEGHVAVGDAVKRLKEQSICLIPAALTVVNDIELEIDERRKQVNATRQSRESESPASWQGTRLPTYALLRRCLSVTESNWASSTSTETLAQLLVLLHSGTYSQSHGSQRKSLVVGTERILSKVVQNSDMDR